MVKIIVVLDRDFSGTYKNNRPVISDVRFSGSVDLCNYRNIFLVMFVSLCLTNDKVKSS